MPATTSNITTDYSKWIRLVVAIHYGGNKICREIFHKHNLCQDGDELYKFLLKFQEDIKNRLRNGIITQTDYDIIFPENSKTDQNLFNTSIYTCLIEVLHGSDYKCLCDRLKKLENLIFSEGNIRYTEEEFRKKWREVTKFLSFLGFEQSEIKTLQSCPLLGPSKYEQEVQDLLCDQVWEVMYESPSLTLGDWKRLTELLNIRFLDTNEKERKTITEHFQQEKITWEKLKKCLRCMNKNNVIKELRKKTNLTTELDELINCYKEDLLNETSRKNTHRQYVELAVAESRIIEQRWRKEIDEKAFHLMKFTIPQSEFRKISMEELLSKSENVTMVTGIPGIGKTTLCQEMKYRWAHQQLWKGEIDILLTITCRILNIYDFSSTEDLIKHLLPNLQNVKLLSEISDRVLLVLDGADEFHNIEELSTNPTQPHLKFFKNVIDISNQKLFSRVIITSRPKIAAFLREFYDEADINCAVQPVEVCGFNDDNVQLFVENQFPDKTVVDKVMLKVKETSTMQAMCSIPIFLKSFCTVYKEGSQIKTPSTMTELLLYTLLTFFKELYKLNGNHQKYKLSLEQLSTDEEVLKHIKNLSRLSHKTLAERKVVFFEEDFDNEILNELEKVGFLSKITHKVKGFVYEYKHLIFQECTSALHILSFDSARKCKDYVNPNFQDTLPLVSGLEGILNRSDIPKYLKSLVQKVTGFEIVDSHNIKSFVEGQLIESIDDFSNQEVFENTYLFAQSENMEIPTEEFIGRVLSQKKFELFERTVVRSQLIRFLSFLLPHIENFAELGLKIHSLDEMRQLVNISRKAKTIDLYFDDNDHLWMEYFKKLSLSTECLSVEGLIIDGSLKFVEINPENFHFLCIIKRMVILDCKKIFAEVLEKLYRIRKQMMLEKLVVKDPTDEELHVICKLFRYVSFITISGNYNKIIHDYMNRNNKLKVLSINYSPEISLEHMVCLEEVHVEFSDDFTVAEEEHMCNQLKKMKYEYEEERRNLKVVKLILLDLPENKCFIDLLNFASNVSIDEDMGSPTITVTI